MIEEAFSLDNFALFHAKVVVMKLFQKLFKYFLLWGYLYFLAACNGELVKRSDYLEERLKPFTGKLATPADVSVSQNKGYVIAIQNKKVFIDLAARDGLKKGILMGIYREGEEEVLMHPITGEALTTLKKEVGTLRILDISDKFSTGYLESLMKGEEVRVGDRVFQLQN